jgi:hypothetical protein
MQFNKLRLRGEEVQNAPILKASSLWKPIRSATIAAQAAINGARLTTVDLVLRTYEKQPSACTIMISSYCATRTLSSKTSLNSMLPYVEASSVGPSGKNSFKSSSRFRLFFVGVVYLVMSR